MAGVEVLGTAAICALTLGFLAAGPRLGLFFAIFVSTGVVYAVLLRRVVVSEATPDAALLVTAALPLWFLGLALVRVMIARSVTLHLLTRLAKRQALDPVHAEIEERVGDLLRLRLVAARGDRLALTAAGRGLARLVLAIYTLFRIAR